MPGPEDPAYIPHNRSLRQRIRPQLEMRGQRPGPFAPFDEPRRAVAVGRPQAATLPAGARVVDAAVEPLRVEAQGIRHAQDDHAVARIRDDAVVQIARRHRHIVAEPERVVLVDPRVVARLGAVLSKALEAGTGILMERPALGAVIPG